MRYYVECKKADVADVYHIGPPDAECPDNHHWCARHFGWTNRAQLNDGDIVTVCCTDDNTKSTWKWTYVVPVYVERIDD